MECTAQSRRCLGAHVISLDRTLALFGSAVRALSSRGTVCRYAQLVGQCNENFGREVIDGDTRRRQRDETADLGEYELKVMCVTYWQAIQSFVGLTDGLAQMSTLFQLITTARHAEVTRRSDFLTN